MINMTFGDLKITNNPRFINYETNPISIVHMKKQNSPEIITIEDQTFGSHVEHWNLLTSNPSNRCTSMARVRHSMHQLCQWAYVHKNLIWMQITWLIQGPAKASHSTVPGDCC